MSRRTVASLLAMGLVVVLGVALAFTSVPYVTMSPGPTLDVLGKSDGKPIVEVEGHRTYPTKGALDLVTVLVTNPSAKLNLYSALKGWIDPTTAVLPHDAVYQPGTSVDEEQAQDAAQMVNSQDTAVAAALTQLGYKLDTFAEVTGVNAAGPSKGELEPRDTIVSIGDRKIDDVDQVFAAMRGIKPGTTVRGVVMRKGERTPFSVKTIADPQDPQRAILGVLVGTGYVFPFDVRVNISDNIGGPSAGLVFALSIYDTLTPGPLLRGGTVAGTGTIAADGSVGPIGGIQQKIVAAHDSGAKLFLVPPDNCAEALRAPVDSQDIRLVRADTFTSALKSLETYTADPSADLPRCTS
jgi:PDZ domain-containing protein